MASSVKYLKLFAICLLALFAVHCIDIGNSDSTKPDGESDASATDTRAEDPLDTTDGPEDADTDASKDVAPDADADKRADTDSSAPGDISAQPAPDADAETDTSSIGPDVDCTATDTSHCVAPPHAQASGCVLGRCSFDCAPGFVDLNTNLGQAGSDGCEYACTPTNGGVEICDGLDNNCDGDVDEGFSGVGDACTAGQGYCAAAGEKTCAPDGLSVVCNAIARAPRQETCNGIDDNCNGIIDDGLGANFYEDRDGDDYGSTATGPRDCNAAGGFSLTQGGDCNDDDANIHPGAAVQCRALLGELPVDFNCNGKTLCQEDACDGRFCRSLGSTGTCQANRCNVIAQEGECTTNSQCPGSDYCDCLPGPGTCCAQGMHCLCLIAPEVEFSED